MITAVAVAPPRTQRQQITAAIRVLDDISRKPGAAAVAHQLTALNGQRAWSRRNVQAACAGLRAFRRLLLHEASTEYWLGQIVGPVRGVEDPDQMELAAKIANQRAEQAATLGVALDGLDALLTNELGQGYWSLPQL